MTCQSLYTADDELTLLHERLHTTTSGVYMVIVKTRAQGNAHG
ncbi:MAG: hypothetical protein ACXV2F_07485 [Halobacteriota archaeon]